MALIEEPQGRRWHKRTYLDGVNALFFLHALEEPGILHEPDLERRPGDHVLSGPLGTGRFARGSIRGFELIAAGKVGEEALLDLIESALP